MADLLDIQEKISSTNAALSRALRVGSMNPNDHSARLNIKSLEKRQGVLERAFLEAARSQQVDVCSYRIIPDQSHTVTVATLASVLGDFQQWVSLVFHAIKNGPQARKNIPVEVAEKTALGFAYAFPGSAGFVLTLTNEQLLFGETELDEAISTISRMAKEDSSEGIVAYARQLGPAPIRVMSSWASSHARAHASVRIDWYRGREVKAELFIQGKEFERLYELIAATSDTTEKSYKGNVELRGVDVDRRSFYVVLPTGDEVRGKFAPTLEITEEHRVELPREYDAEILTRTTVKYATDEEAIEHVLLALTPLDP